MIGGSNSAIEFPAIIVPVTRTLRPSQARYLRCSERGRSITTVLPSVLSMKPRNISSPKAFSRTLYWRVPRRVVSVGCGCSEVGAASGSVLDSRTSGIDASGLGGISGALFPASVVTAMMGEDGMGSRLRDSREQADEQTKAASATQRYRTEGVTETSYRDPLILDRWDDLRLGSDRRRKVQTPGHDGVSQAHRRE